MSDYISEIVRGVINRHIDKDDCSEATYNLRIALFNEFCSLLKLKHLSVDSEEENIYKSIEANVRGLVALDKHNGQCELTCAAEVDENGVVEVITTSFGWYSEPQIK